jgi:hypothetical protein
MMELRSGGIRFLWRINSCGSTWEIFSHPEMVIIYHVDPQMA